MLDILTLRAFAILSSVTTLKKSFKKALNMAEIDDFKFHDFRHVFASRLVGGGVDLYVVQKLLGHSTPLMTQRYAHLQPNQMQDAIQKLDLQNLNIRYNDTSFWHQNGTKGFSKSEEKLTAAVSA
jgi:integrase